MTRRRRATLGRRLPFFSRLGRTARWALRRLPRSADPRPRPTCGPRPATCPSRPRSRSASGSEGASPRRRVTRPRRHLRGRPAATRPRRPGLPDLPGGRTGAEPGLVSPVPRPDRRRPGATVVEADGDAARRRSGSGPPVPPSASRTAADGVAGTVALDGDAGHALADLDLFVCRAALGVAENGAMWLPESALGATGFPRSWRRHVAVVLSAATVVAGTMHDALRGARGRARGVRRVRVPGRARRRRHRAVAGDRLRTSRTLGLTVVLVP